MCGCVLGGCVAVGECTLINADAGAVHKWHAAGWLAATREFRAWKRWRGCASDYTLPCPPTTCTPHRTWKGGNSCASYCATAPGSASHPYLLRIWGDGRGESGEGVS